MISEFMAVNNGFLQDEDGESPDWIEIHNTSGTEVNLGGWHLTDNYNNLAKWTFPATNLPPFGHLIVFASGKNRAVAGRELHTNFELASQGEYLALVAPDGVTVAHEYAPAYPLQRGNVSYGVYVESFVTPVVITGATARVLVPSDGALGLNWTARVFDDSGWMSTNSPVGFAVGTVPTPVLALDVNERGANASTTTQAGFTSFVINSNVSSSAIETQAVTRVYGNISVTVSNTAPYGYDDRLRTTPENTGTFTESLLLRDFIFSRDDTGTGGLDITLSGLTPNLAHRFTIWSFDTGSGGNRVADWSANGVLVASAYTFNGNNWPASNEQYRFSFEAPADNTGVVVLSGRRVPPSNSSFGVFLNALQVETLASVAATNGLAALMLSNNASAYIRIPFTVSNPGELDLLRLRIRYNDGFVAYLNGQLVVARNAPATPQWNSTATVGRSEVETLVPEEIHIPNSPGLLVAGENVLAIHGMNVNANDANFLIVPELEGVVSGAYMLRYFSPATPGELNDSGYLGLVADTEFSVTRGFYDTPFTVAITSATASASVYWTTNGSPPSPTNGTLYTAPVSVTGNTFLRAAAFLANHVPSVPVTHTYLFLNQVLQQPNNPPGYPTTWQASYPADYEMDPNVVNHPNYGTTLSNDLRAIPTLSLVSDHNTFWHPSTGIYVDATRSGILWERAASVELFNGDNTSEFQINCGVRMQGNASRDNVRLAKHAFRLLFKSAYGPSKLDHDWFGGGVSRFDNIVLRACFTDSWATRYSPDDGGARYRPEDSLYLRDVWVKDSLRDMGHLSGRGNFVHLYVNGLYWGIYNPTERLDASFFSQQLGGLEADWDVIRDFTELLDGTPDDWDQMMALVNAGVTSEASYQAVAELVDVENLIDYMLLHFFGEAEDWPHHNWYAAHRRANPVNGLPATKWIFLSWDQEIVLDQLVTRNRVGVNNNNTPARIYSQLRAWPEFRRLFGDRVQQHLFNAGALSVSNNITRMQGLAARLDRAIVGESARWGDAREFTIGVNPGHGQTFTRDEWWAPELHKLYTNFFPNLNALTLSRLRAANLYPGLDAPEFSQFGGDVPAGFNLSMMHANPSGAVYFTLDGSDPRTYGSGAITPTAQAYETPIPINQPVLVRARVLAGTNWSALVEATFTPPQDLSKLALTEIMYNPPDLEAIPGNALEFLELKNVGTNTLNLSDLTFSAGITFMFPEAMLVLPGEFVVLVRNAAAFAVKYPGVAVQGTYTGQLDNAGETVTLSFPSGGNVFSVTYRDRAPWPVTPDGHGFSLVPKQPGLTQAPDQGDRWRASALSGGSPGANDPEPIIPPILVNEILTHTDLPQRDAVELHNPTGADVDLSGWWLTDDAATPAKYRIPIGTLLPAGGYILFDETQFNTGTDGNVPFAFSSLGEDVYLFSATTNGQLTGYNHGFAFGAAFNNVSFGRYVNSVGEELFPAQTEMSLGAPNPGPRVGPIVLNEIHYHPAGAEDEEFIELLNTSDETVAFFDLEYPTNTWIFRGIGYSFPAGITLGPAELLLLVPIEPAEFRAKYNVPAEVQVLGPYSGRLDNGGERLALDAPDGLTAGVVPYVTVEEVRYRDDSPWLPAADGSGPSLQRVSALAYGNDPINWVAAAPTPGQFSPTADSDGDGLPDGWEIAHGTNWRLPDADTDLDADGMSNWEEFLAGTHPNDPESSLRLEVFRAEAGTVALQFLAVSNRTYSVLYAESLIVPMWFKLADAPMHDTNRVETVTNSTALSSDRFYRLVTPMQP
ncbi:MAG: lamin tail domain-containing protein [Verrucomicrobiae bacterium]|nr:lamin tail domain-containing protein [Verrucomicrobiae bacterium]